MPDSEMLKLIINGGSFGLLAICTVWLLFYGAPMFRDTLKYMADRQDSVINKIIKEFREDKNSCQQNCAADREACRNSRHLQGNRLVDTVAELMNGNQRPEKSD